MLGIQKPVLIGFQKYKGGLILLVVVVVIWVASAETTQSIFIDYEHPFVVTYLGTSMLVAYLAISFIKGCLVKFVKTHFRNIKSTTLPDIQMPPNEQSPLLGSTHSSSKNYYHNNNNYHGLVGRNTSDSEIEQHEQLGDCSEEDQGETSVGGSEGCHQSEDIVKFKTKEIAIFALTIGPIWFVSEYFTNAALARTSVATTTILFSTSGLFTLIIDACLERQSLTLVNIVAVIVSMCGVALTTVGKTWARDETQPTSTGHRKFSIVGDIFALISALTDGLYYVLLKRYAGEEGEKVDMQKFLGFVGLFTLTTLWWLIWPLRAIGVEPKFAMPQSAKVAEIVLANCFIGNFISDYFWAMGVVWTSPLIAALGASLTIPLAMLGDMLIHGRHYSFLYILGSVGVFLGFVIASLSDWISPKLKVRKKFFNGENEIICR